MKIEILSLHNYALFTFIATAQVRTTMCPTNRFVQTKPNISQFLVT